MKTSARGLDLIKSLEGLKLNAYRCQAGVLTIGYGHTAGVHDGDKCSQEQAEEWLRQDVSWAEKAVTDMTVRTTQNQFDALVSFVFNCGSRAFMDSSLLKMVNSNPNAPAIRDEFMKWVYSRGKRSAGLENRRRKEADLYFNI